MNPPITVSRPGKTQATLDGVKCTPSDLVIHVEVSE